MMDWKTVSQSPSDNSCVACGGSMNRVEPIKDKKGRVYEGIVCHACKAVFWLKRD
jgi:hypothetical protein